MCKATEGSLVSYLGLRAYIGQTMNDSPFLVNHPETCANNLLEPTATETFQQCLSLSVREYGLWPSRQSGLDQQC